MTGKEGNFKGYAGQSRSPNMPKQDVNQRSTPNAGKDSP